jgi:hypothetical protein
MNRHLLVIDHAYRGSVEVQFSHLLYLAQGLHGQLRGTDVALYGTAVTLAVEAPPPPSLPLGTATVERLPDPGPALRSLLAAGASVFVEHSGLDALGLARERLVEGVLCRTEAQLARQWPDYEEVWFL